MIPYFIAIFMFLIFIVIILLVSLEYSTRRINSLIKHIEEIEAKIIKEVKDDMW